MISGYKDSFYTDGIITIPAGFFPTRSCCKHVLVNDERLATVILKAPAAEYTFTTGTLDGSPSALPALTAIKEHDRQYKTEYYRTLFCFLRNERRHRPTAEELFIHRNTLFQRLERLQALWPLDLDDNEERFYLLFSFYQDQYAKPAHIQEESG